MPRRNKPTARTEMTAALSGERASIPEMDATQAIEEALEEADPKRRREMLTAVIAQLRKRATEVGDTEALADLADIERELLGSPRHPRQPRRSTRKQG